MTIISFVFGPHAVSSPLPVFIHVLNIFLITPELFSSTGLLPPKKKPPRAVAA